jgi:hypothetical protein
MSPAVPLLLAATRILLHAAPGLADGPSATSSAAAPAPARPPGPVRFDEPSEDVRLPETSYRLELKAAATNRAAPEETSRTTLRGEIRPATGPLLAFRADLVWVDKNNDFATDPTYAGLGDLAVKGTFRAPDAGQVELTPYLELKLPTGGSAALGSGKLVAVPGLVARHRLPWTSGGRPMVASAEPAANVSVAGDPERADVGYASLELKLLGRLAPTAGFEWAVKPVYDWVKGGQTAGVTELTGDWTPGPWRLALTAGRRLWGGAVGGTYDDKLELSVRRAW